MTRKANIVTNDPYDRNLLEIFISNQQKILDGQHRIEERLDAMEAKLSATLNKNTNKEPEPFFTEKQLIAQLQLSRQTICKYRRDGILTYTKRGRTIRYSQTDIDNLKRNIA